MGISAHDVTTTFRSSSTAATAAKCRTEGRLKRTRPTGMRRNSWTSDVLSKFDCDDFRLPANEGDSEGQSGDYRTKARDVKSGETVIDRGTRFTI